MSETDDADLTHEDTIPMQLHTHSLDKAGCPNWTHAFLKFIGDIIPERVISENKRWWTND